MKFPNRIQAALLLDKSFEDLDALTRDFARIAELKSGAAFSIPEQRPGAFTRLFGGGADLMVTFEYIPAPPQETVFETALNSPVTTIRTPDMPERITDARSHILLDVSQGTLGALDLDPDKASFLHELGASALGATCDDFRRRLETLVLMVRVAIDHTRPSAIHWTQSDQLFDSETFEAAATEGFPGPLTVHPLLYSEADPSDAPGAIGLRTFGARHWLGRELHVRPSVLPWSAAYRTLVEFCAASVAEDGGVTAHEQTYEPARGDEIWRVCHRELGEDPLAQAASHDAVAVYELEPLRHDACQFLTEEYARNANVLCERTPKAKAEPHVAEQEGKASRDDPQAQSSPAASNEPSALDDEVSCLAELEAALAEGRAEAAANPPDPLPANLSMAMPSQPGDATVSGRSLRAKVFGAKDAVPGEANEVCKNETFKDA